MVCYCTLTTFDSQPSTSIFTEGWGNLDTTSNSVVAKSVFMMLQKSFISLLIESLPVRLIRILASKCIQYTDKKCLLRHPHICVMCKKENSVNFEFHATFPWLTIDYFAVMSFDTNVSMSQKRVFRHLVIFVDQLWKFRFRNVFFIVEAPKE